jgi:signal transduction histidine kinase
MSPAIRMRFALLCGAVVFVIGSVLLTVAYFLVRAGLQPQSDLTRPNVIAADIYCTGNPADPSVPRCPITLHSHTQEYKAINERVSDVRRAYQRRTLDSLRTKGAAVVAVGGVSGVGFGWTLAGWALRPLRRVNETARRVAQSHDLTDRIGYTGPGDELRELAETFDTMLARVARTFDGQRRFVANASHELRTPLAINRTLVDVALRRPEATEDVKRLGESLLVVNTRHERLVEGLLALADSEQAVLVRHPLDLADVAEHVLDQTAAEAAKRQVTIHRLAQPAATAGDSVLLERLVQNLVENGIRHNSEGGELWVITRQRGDEKVELVVANTGPTVPAYEVDTIFEPFRRLNADRVRSDRGSGLGLSIVRSIVGAHSGTVTAEPREQGGLTVSIELPGP